MTHTYQLTGMTCGGCENKVKSNLLVLPDVTSVEVSKDTNSAKISTDKHISLDTLQQALGGAESKYQIAATAYSEVPEETKSWVATYKPILIIFGYVTAISLAVSWQDGAINFMTFIMNFL